MKPIIRVENLTHTYGENTPFCRSAVKDVNMEIMEGEFLGVIGHTGSGKSTLIQHLNGLLRPTSGRVLLGDRDIWEDPKKIRDVRFRVGLVFQYPEYQLFEETVYKDVAFGPKNMGLDEKEIDRRVRASLAFSGLGEALLEKSPFDLSGGQKRRVAIAGVIAMERAWIRRAAGACWRISAPTIGRRAPPWSWSATAWTRWRRTWTGSWSWLTPGWS